MSWDKVSDFEINKAMAELQGYSVKTMEAGGRELQVMQRVLSGGNLGSPFRLTDYCNSWEDMGQLISENKIDLKYQEISDDEWFAGVSSDDDNFYEHWWSNTNPLRAAAIVYLMMNNVKPENLTGGTL